jgi:hypothetical protein
MRMIDHEKKQTLLTADTRMGKNERDALESADGIVIGVDELRALAEMARERKLEYDVVACAGMTAKRAVRIRELRKTSSWRAIAATCFQEWGADAMWHPESNQLAGMALCEAAAARLGESPEAFPWQVKQ